MSAPGSARVMTAPAEPFSARPVGIARWDDLCEEDSQNVADMDFPSTHTLSTKPRAPEFSFGIKPKGLRRHDVPGPGSYYDADLGRLARYTNKPHFSFGSATRQDPKKPRVPGPGTYVQKTFIGRESASFSCTPRRPDFAPRGKTLPGPGAHDVPSSMGKSGPRHSMTPRRPAKPIGGAWTSPGPGDYDAGDGLIRGAPPKWGFGSSAQRGAEPRHALEPTPGPGTYRHDSARGGPQFSMRARTVMSPRDVVPKW